MPQNNVMNIGLAADHGGFELKEKIKTYLKDNGHKVHDFGAFEYDKQDDYPDFIIPMARSVAEGNIERGIAVCGSGVGASVAANKIAGVRAALIHEGFSAHQGVEDDNINVLCLGGRVIGSELAFELIVTFLKARFSGAERHIRRLLKVNALEKKNQSYEQST